MTLVLDNCRIFDGWSAEVAEDRAILVEDGVIRDIAATGSFGAAHDRIDAGGRFVMPGLIDAHFHAYGMDMNPGQIDRTPPVIRGLHAKHILEAALQRGFTTLRDAAGGDIDLATALRTGLIDGPRFFFPGLAISQTGGHGDMRAPDHFDACGCAYCGSMSVIADGPDAMRRTVREQLRRGATQIKLFVSGGVLSPSDPIWMNQFAIEEIRAAVEEAATRRTYVMAHAHTNEAAIRCVENGVRSIEHATMVEEDGVRAIVERGAFAVPTLAIIDAIYELGPTLGLPPALIAKTREVGEHALTSLDRLRSGGAQIGFGSDLLGKPIERQSFEFRLRLPVCTPLEILRSATSVNARLLQMEGKLGVIAPDALADLLVVDGDPLADVAILERHERILLIMRDGRLCKNRLDG